MKIGIHNEPAGESIGGSEVCVAVLAEAMSVDHEVEILHHYPELSAEKLGSYANTDLNRVSLRYLPRPLGKVSDQGIWSKYRNERREQKELTGGYDVFITFSHMVPPFCSARTGVLVVLFPFIDFVHFSGSENSEHHHIIDSIKNRLRSRWHRWKFESQLRSYQIPLSISDFTRKWTKSRWRLETDIVFPPAGLEVEITEKENSILSVGRFSATGVKKMQLEMVQNFADLTSSGQVGWQFDCVGGCGTSADDLGFFESVKKRGDESGASVRSNITYANLKSLYKKAKIFWHAAGMGIDEESQPELAEHFGITTVEAMSAGCVPVVINKGGQSEIVEHGISGFLWNNLEEWKNYSTLLMQNDELRRRMSIAARQRSLNFGRTAFIERINSKLAPFLNQN